MTDARLFQLVRDEDVTGISGTGTVADGVQFPDDVCVIRWRGERQSTAVYPSIEDVEAIHGHGGATRIVWSDAPAPAPDPTPTPEPGLRPLEAEWRVTVDGWLGLDGPAGTIKYMRDRGFHLWTKQTALIGDGTRWYITRHGTWYSEDGLEPWDESEPEPAPTPEPAPEPSTTLPSDVLDLTNWKLTLPILSSGSPKEIFQPALKGYKHADYFAVKDDGVVFTAPVEGGTTENSSYPRSELREMKNGGRDHANWDSSKGSHTMALEGRVTELPKVKPHIVIAQIHDKNDDVCMVRLEGRKLFVEAEGFPDGLLDGDYRLGQKYGLKVIADADWISHAYHNFITGKTADVHIRKTASGCYFKAGAYTQSNRSKGDVRPAQGQAVIHALTVSHT